MSKLVVLESNADIFEIYKPTGDILQRVKVS